MLKEILFTSFCLNAASMNLICVGIIALLLRPVNLPSYGKLRILTGILLFTF